MQNTSSLSRSAGSMAIGTFLSRITGFGRIVALGYALGYAAFSDAYVLANNVPNIIYELVVGGVLAATLVPVFVQQLAVDKDGEAWRAISAIFTATAVALTVLVIAVLTTAPLIIDLYTMGNTSPLAEEQREVATFLLRLFTPQLACYGFISLAGGLLHAKRNFGPPMFAPIFNNLVIICILVALPHVSVNTSLEAMHNDMGGLLFLGIGTTAGVLAMALFLVPHLLRLSKGNLHFRWEPKHPSVIKVLKMSGWTIGFVIANQLAFFVTVVLANRHAGDLTAFLSAYTLFILPHGIIAVSIMSALQPELAEKWAHDLISELRNLMTSGLRIVLVIMLPAAVGYALIADPFTQLTLAYGQVTDEAAYTAARILFWLALGLPGFSVFIFWTRVLQAMHDARTVFWIYVLQNGLNVITAFPLYKMIGITGLAMSQSLAYSGAALVGALVLRQRMQWLNGRVLVKFVLRVVSSTMVMGLSVWSLVMIFEDRPMVQVLSAILVGALVYMFTLRLLGISEIQELLRGGRTAAITGKEQQQL